MGIALAALPLLSQSDPEGFRIEITASALRTGVEGAVQAGTLPIDLHSDLNLSDRFTFFGKLVLKPARKHAVVIEGAPFSFEGRQILSRSITFNGRTYSISDEVRSRADLAYFFGGYQYDFLSGRQGHLGVQLGGAYLSASGIIQGVTSVITTTRNQTIGIPLMGLDARVFPVAGRSLCSISGDVKGMALGSHGHHVQCGVHAGIGVRWIRVQAGFAVIDADIHESGAAPVSGINPKITGPIFSLQFRR